jgi:hypothetical protein
MFIGIIYSMSQQMLKNKPFEIVLVYNEKGLSQIKHSKNNRHNRYLVTETDLYRMPKSAIFPILINMFNCYGVDEIKQDVFRFYHFYI